MSKIDQIAARIANGWKYGDDPDLDWLIVRVRQLETALKYLADHDIHDHPDSVAREALKES